MPAHIEEICSDYGAKLQSMIQHLESFPEGVRFTRPEGGLFIWAELPDCLDALLLLQQSIEQKVAYVPGTHFFVNGGHRNTLRLNFSNSTMNQIDTGMDILRDIVSNALKQ